jgi:transcriptional regulator GlxA family with amidase domain
MYELVGQVADERTIAVQLQPVIDTILASLREGQRFAQRDVALTLPASGGTTLVVSVRAELPRVEKTLQPGSRGLDARQLRLVDGAIAESIGEPISVSMLSSVAGLSRSHFSRAFRASVGRTPHEHVVRVRIDRAMELMRTTKRPLSDIAVATGFSDQAHFSNKFRRFTGLTPSRWRAVHGHGAAQPTTPVPAGGF